MVRLLESEEESTETKRSVEDGLKELDKKIEKTTAEIEKMNSIMSKGTIAEILDYCGYRIVKVPISSHCDENLLKEFI